MPLNRPTLPQLLSRTVADIQARLPGSDPLKRFSILGGIAHALANGFHSLHSWLEFYAKQSNPATATGKYLTLWAGLWLEVPRLDASKASGYADFSGAADTEIPVGVQLQSTAGVEYVTTEAGVLDENGQASIAIEATTAGPEGNLPTAALLKLVSPASDVSSDAYVATGGLAGGVAQEDDERLRVRLRQRIQAPPHGGAEHDYERWALEVPGVAQVWVDPLYSGDGTVQVWIGEADYEGANHASGALVDQADGYIKSPARKPVTANVTVAGPMRNPVAHDITLYPNTPAVRAAVTAELDQLYQRDAVPEGKILISRIREAVSIAAGEDNNVVNAPIADAEADAGEILTRGEITFS